MRSTLSFWFGALLIAGSFLFGVRPTTPEPVVQAPETEPVVDLTEPNGSPANRFLGYYDRRQGDVSIVTVRSQRGDSLEFEFRPDDMGSLKPGDLFEAILRADGWEFRQHEGTEWIRTLWPEPEPTVKPPTEELVLPPLEIGKAFDANSPRESVKTSHRAEPPLPEPVAAGPDALPPHPSFAPPKEPQPLAGEVRQPIEAPPATTVTASLPKNSQHGALRVKYREGRGLLEIWAPRGSHLWLLDQPQGRSSEGYWRFDMSHAHGGNGWQRYKVALESPDGRQEFAFVEIDGRHVTQVVWRE